MNSSSELLRASVRGRFLVVLLLALAVSLIAAGRASAVNFPVDTLADGSDINTADGVCATNGPPPNCTLRAAIDQANASSAADDITFSITGTHLLTLGPLIPSSGFNLTITGNGSGPSGTVIDGQAAGRVIQVGEGSADLNLNSLRVQNGRVTDANCCQGAGIFSRFMRLTLDHVVVTGNTVSITPGGGHGAGIENGNRVNVIDSTISGNTITSGGGVGAGIFAGGEVSMVRSTVSGNSASDSNARGGGLYISSARPVVEIANSTFSGNSAGSGGGAIQTQSAMTIVNTTIASNTTTTGAGGIQSNISDPAQVVTLENAILSSNTAPNCAQQAGGGSFVATNSIDSGTSCAFGNTNGNKSSTDPELGPLADNGGTTQTHLPDTDSPALNAGSSDCGVPPGPAGEADNDQRGVTRPQGPACDIGAVELLHQTLTVTKAGTGAGTVTGPNINCGVDCNETYPDGTMVTLTATPSDGSQFSGWSGCDSTMGNQCTVTVNGAESVTATFDLIPRTLTVARAGTGSGTVTGPGIDCGTDCTDTQPHGTMITLTAVPAAGSSFAGWSNCDTPAGNQCTVTLDGDETVTATFTINPMDQPPATGLPLTTPAPAAALPFDLAAALKKCKKKRSKRARKRCIRRAKQKAGR